MGADDEEQKRQALVVVVEVVAVVVGTPLCRKCLIPSLSPTAAV
jgi:hypothetical protein